MPVLPVPRLIHGHRPLGFEASLHKHDAVVLVLGAPVAATLHSSRWARIEQLRHPLLDVVPIARMPIRLPAESVSSQSSYRLADSTKQAFTHSIVMTGSGARTSYTGSNCGTAPEVSISSSAVAAPAIGLTFVPGALPLDSTRTRSPAGRPRGTGRHLGAPRIVDADEPNSGAPRTSPEHVTAAHFRRAEDVCKQNAELHSPPASSNGAQPVGATAKPLLVTD